MAYQSFMKEIFRVDPSNAMISFADMMKTQIVMPAELMTDGRNPALFDDFSRVAQKIHVYTAVDYAHIIGARACAFSGRFWQVLARLGFSWRRPPAPEAACRTRERASRREPRARLARTAPRLTTARRHPRGRVHVVVRLPRQRI
jgi:acyl-[acyl-carrier-protein] desaturase